MHIFQLFKLRPKYGLKNWPRYGLEQELSLSDCIDIIPYLKVQTGVSESQNLWDDEKVNVLSKTTRNRKRWYGVATISLSVCALISAYVLLLALVCIFSGIECEASLGRYINLAFALFTFITTSFYLWGQSISRDKHNVVFSDYLNSDLSSDQKQAVIQAILQIKRETAQLFEIANYESLRKIPKIFWKAENWFLLLTENEKDRRAIWLKGIYPKGKIYIPESVAASRSHLCMGVQKDIAPPVGFSEATKAFPDQAKNKVDDTPDFVLVALGEIGEPWAKLKKPYSKYLYSEKARLKDFVERMKAVKKNKFQTAWHNAMMMLLDSYSDYPKYLTDSHAGRKFEEKFIHVFALISDDYHKTQNKGTTLTAKHYDLGIGGTRKFLLGNQENIENWIRQNLT